MKKHEKALKINEKIENLAGKVTCLNNIGNTYFDLKDYSKALEIYTEGLQIANQL
ncbi:unnamed protein product, partial [marine sediment metagenome]